MPRRQIAKHFWVDEERRTGAARLVAPVQLLARPERGGAAPAPAASGQPAPVIASQFYHDGTVNVGGASTEISPLSTDQILPRESDLYFLTMRAISQKVLEGHWVDYTRPGVLQASVPLLLNQRICKDHEYRKTEDAIGAIVQTAWDEQGAQSNNIPGINIRFFIDSKIAPGIVRRLAYPVPAIHSGSVTVGFEWEPSHPELLEQKKFWWFLGEEVEGSIVRLIATQILFYEEFSLVYQGADSDAKRLPDEMMPADDAGDEDDEYKRKKMNSAANAKENAVKLTVEQKKTLGLAHAADEVPDAEVLAAIDRLSAETARLTQAADAIISAERAEVVRLATLVEADAEGKLPNALATIINAAPAAQLPELKALYEQKAKGKLGVGANGIGRSSVESNPITQPAQATQGDNLGWL